MTTAGVKRGRRGLGYSRAQRSPRQVTGARRPCPGCIPAAERAAASRGRAGTGEPAARRSRGRAGRSLVLQCWDVECAKAALEVCGKDVILDGATPDNWEAMNALATAKGFECDGHDFSEGGGMMKAV